MSSQSDSTSTTIELPDPTTLAISLIPLLPSSLTSSTNNRSKPINIPILAASLSTLPGNVINAIHVLGQELKNLREEQLLSDSFQTNHSRRQTNATKSDTSEVPEQDSLTREQREKWLENQKINHLTKSISSLTNLHSSLQSRHLNTVDTLSNLQQVHNREKQQLTDERDGVRAVNTVLRRKICNLEKQLDASKEVMEGVLEKVEIVNAGDWSIVDHGRIHVNSPLIKCHPQAVECDNSSVFSLFEGSYNRPPSALDLNASGLSHSGSHIHDTSQHLAAGHLHQSTSSAVNNQRSLTLIVELTEEMESLREEAKTELESKDDEIRVLKRLVRFRDDEIKILITRLENFMGLNGFYIPVKGAQSTDAFIQQDMLDLHDTPKQHHISTLKGKEKAGLDIDRSHVNPLDGDYPWSRTHENQYAGSVSDGSNRSRSHPLSRPGPTHDHHPSGDEFDSLTSLDTCENEALSRALADLSNQVLDLKYALKEVSNERDTLRRLRSKHTRTSESPPNGIEEDYSSLKKALKELQSERNRLNEDLIQVERKNFELEKRITEQEGEFERVAERVQNKLEEQRRKLYEAKHEIEELSNRLEQSQGAEKILRRELEEEKRRGGVLMSLMNNKKDRERERDSSSTSSTSRRSRYEKPVPSKPRSRLDSLDEPTTQ
ncbi:hypothetical protein DFH28DRAFT_1079540 [Melampsora americana]|nr:hypothetical protein DFH28DRAFT_1079540 [Melampsora americana]